MWTIRMPPDSVKVEADSKTIVWRLKNFATQDYHDVVNALRPGTPGPSVPAIVSFSIRWGDVIKVVEKRDTQERFAGRLIYRNATVEWEAEQGDFKFVSGPANTSQNKLSLIVVERNGSYFA